MLQNLGAVARYGDGLSSSRKEWDCDPRLGFCVTHCRESLSYPSKSFFVGLADGIAVIFEEQFHRCDGTPNDHVNFSFASIYGRQEPFKSRVPCTYFSDLLARIVSIRESFG